MYDEPGNLKYILQQKISFTIIGIIYYDIVHMRDGCSLYLTKIVLSLAKPLAFRNPCLRY
jgi:hypothetical protein